MKNIDDGTEAHQGDGKRLTGHAGVVNGSLPRCRQQNPMWFRLVKALLCFGLDVQLGCRSLSSCFSQEEIWGDF